MAEGVVGTGGRLSNGEPRVADDNRGVVAT